MCNDIYLRKTTHIKIFPDDDDDEPIAKANRCEKREESIIHKLMYVCYQHVSYICGEIAILTYFI